MSDQTARASSRTRAIEILTGFCIFCCIAGLLVFPVQASNGVRDGIQLCLDVIVPCLLPFFVMSAMLVETGCAGSFGLLLEPVMRPVFNINGACASAVALGFLGGYPVGARTAITLYQKGLCNKVEAERLLSFCNNSGPAFILGVVGVGIFANSRAGLLLFLAHTASSLTIGFLFRFYKRGAPKTVRASSAQPPAGNALPKAFIRSINTSCRSMLGICAFVIFFTVAIKMLFLSGILPALAEALGFALAPFGMTARSAEHLLTGLIEMVSGLRDLSGSSASLTGRLSMAAFMLGWAGLSVHCQVLSFIGESGLKSWTYIIGKILHAAFSAGYTWLMAGLFHLDQSMSDYLTEQVGAFSRMDFSSALGVSLMVALGVWVLFLWLAWVGFSRRKRFKVI